MYQFSYNDVVEESPSVMRAQEREAMNRIITMLRTAVADGEGGQTEIVKALYYLRSLWAIFLADLGSPENELPLEVRGGLISIGTWVHREIDAYQSGVRADLLPLIEINEIVRDGLK